jgi:AcrR family transcriptional regulator
VETPKLRPGKPGGKRDLNRKRRRAQICASALELFATNGVDQTSIDQITAAAGIAKGSFYRHFADKKELVGGLFAPIAMAITEATDACVVDVGRAQTIDDCVTAYVRMGDQLAPHLLSQPLLIRVYLQERSALDEGPRGMVRAIADLVARQAVLISDAGHAKGFFRDDVPHVLSALLVVGAVERVAELFLEAPQALELSPSEIGPALVRLVLDGLVPRKRSKMF